MSVRMYDTADYDRDGIERYMEEVGIDKKKLKKIVKMLEHGDDDDFEDALHHLKFAMQGGGRDYDDDDDDDDRMRYARGRSRGSYSTGSRSGGRSGGRGRRRDSMGRYL